MNRKPRKQTLCFVEFPYYHNIFRIITEKQYKTLRKKLPYLKVFFKSSPTRYKPFLEKLQKYIPSDSIKSICTENAWLIIEEDYNETRKREGN